MPRLTRIMTWNILHGGRDPVPANVHHVSEVIATARPDVLVLVETYGSGELITQALNVAAAPGVHYSGHPITQAAPGGDNLWVAHRLELVRTYLNPVGISTFHFGGIRLRDPSDTEFNVFACWLNHLPRHRLAIESDIAALRAGRRRPYGDEALAALDGMTRDALNPDPGEPADRPDSSRRSQAARILDQALPGFVADSPRTPTIIAGDLNSVSHLDWSEPNRNLSRHYGIAVPWTVTTAFEQAGFRDTFRVANPDVDRAPGATRLPRAQSFAADYRIDYILVRGAIQVRDAWMIDERWAAHGPGMFYSDHAAQVTDVTFVPADIP